MAATPQRLISMGASSTDTSMSVANERQPYRLLEHAHAAIPPRTEPRLLLRFQLLLFDAVADFDGGMRISCCPRRQRWPVAFRASQPPL